MGPRALGNRSILADQRQKYEKYFKFKNKEKNHLDPLPHLFCQTK